MGHARVAVVGGGIVGATIAYDLIGRGASVTLFESEDRIGAGVSSRAIGGITPISDDYLRGELFDLSLHSAEHYRDWLDRLSAAAGTAIPYLDGGLLYVYFDEANRAKIQGMVSQVDGKAEIHELCSSSLQEKEPLISTRALGAFHIPVEGAVEPVCVLEALSRVLRQNPAAELRLRCTVTALESTPAGIVVSFDDVGHKSQSRRVFDRVVLAQGLGVTKLLPKFAKTMLPVKGEALEFRASRKKRPISRYHVYAKVPADALPAASMQGTAKAGVGPCSYVVPRADGRVVVGVTYLERETSEHVSWAGQQQIQNATAFLWPSCRDWHWIRSWSGIRPGTADSCPLIGPLASEPRILLATGHLGVGVTMAPVTAELVAHFMGLGQGATFKATVLARVDPNRGPKKRTPKRANAA